MSELHSFVPYVRTGLLSGGAAPITVTMADHLSSAPFDLQVAGPEDVEGIDSRAVVRTWPRENVFDGEPNFLAALEFGEPDMPWRFSPRSTEPFLPWINLLVLADEEVAGVAPPTASRKAPLVSIKPGTPLSNLSEAAAWCHAHAVGYAVSEALDGHSEAIVSRILCPRRMRPRTSYTGFLVPTFMRGAMAGRGQSGIDAVDPSALAWTAETAGENFVLPIYYSWRFGTGTAGDFEELARKLSRRVVPGGLGSRPISLARVSATLKPSLEARVESALRPARDPDHGVPAPPAVDPAVRSGFVELLNMTASNGDPVVTLPMYGRWHAGRASVAEGPSPRPWFDELNLDVGSRVAASLGANVVRKSQQALMASAWQQVESIRRANDALRTAQLAREASNVLHQRMFVNASVDRVLQFAGPLKNRVRIGGRTLGAQLHSSVLPRGLDSSAFRRIIRPLGTIAKRQDRLGAIRGHLPGLASRIASGGLIPIASRPTPDLATPLRLAALAGAADSTLHERLTEGGVSTLGNAAALASQHSSGESSTGASRFALSPAQRRALGRVGGTSGTLALTAPPQLGGGPLTDERSASVALDSFRTALGSLGSRLNVRPPATLRLPIDLAAVKAAFQTHADPRVTIARSLRARIDLRDGAAWHRRDPLEPIMAAPDFPQPMSEPLRDLSREWILGGLSNIPPDTVALLEPNRRFIEAYMVGLNHEFARELLWAGYPTDQRGSYFRQFWDPRSRVTEPDAESDAESVEDVAPVHMWRGLLGTHPANPSEDPPLVILIRGELIRRYPGAAVYLAKSNGTQRKDPIFSGALPPDTAFYAFGLSVEGARGSDRDGVWYFVVEEHVSASRFGFEIESENTHQTTWHSLGVDEPGRYVRSTRLADAADVAVNTYRRPVRVIMPVSYLLDRTSEDA